MNISHSDQISTNLLLPPARGFLEISRIYTNGLIEVDNVLETEIIFYKENLVVDAARESLAHLVGGDTLGDFVIREMHFGEGGHNPDNVVIPKAPDPSATQLFQPILTGSGSGVQVNPQSIQLVTPDYPERNKVRFRAEIAATELNGAGGAGQPVSEAGLFDGRGFMFAHRTFGVISKNSNFSLILLWTVVF